MKNCLHQRPSLRALREDERGMSLVFVAVGLMSFMAATTLAIDVGMFMTARNQAQNSADAGALAGAVALAQNSFTDRTASGPAVQSAVLTARENRVVGDDVDVTPDDVTFPAGPTGATNRVQVQVYRTVERENAVPTLLGKFFGVPSVDIMAKATAEASPANAMTCVKPFMIPDKWIENQTPPWDPSDEFDKYRPNGTMIDNPDTYIGSGPTYSGYSYTNDIGRELTLRAATGNEINPSFYYSWKMPGDTGGEFYRENIANCNTSRIIRGANIVQEPGAMEGPTIQGILELIAKDPDAYWDTSCNCVKGSRYTGQSPRVFPIPLYDPLLAAENRRNGRAADYVVANFLGFFAVRVQGNGIYGRVTRITGMVDETAAMAPDDSLPMAIRLVQ
jgi:Flp pilus assembly protein TadG